VQTPSKTIRIECFVRTDDLGMMLAIIERAIVVNIVRAHTLLWDYSDFGVLSQKLAVVGGQR